MLATETTSSYMPPLPAGLADLPTPELMAIVMRRIGEGCTLADFQQAAETCDLTEARLNANIGAATRIIMLDGQRNDGPLRPLMPWDADPSYRVELVKEGGRLVALGMADTADIVARLLRNGFDPQAMIALWDEIISEAINQLHRNPPIAPLARIVADLEAALDAYDQPGINAETRSLIHSMRSALDAIRGERQVSRHHVLRTADAFAATLEFRSFPGDHTPKVRAAVDLLRKLWGL